MTIEPIHVVDRHALIWYLTDDKKLGKRAAEIFASAERGETRLVVSAVVVAEMYYANQKHKWFADFKAVYDRMKAKPYFRFVHFKADHVLNFDRDAGIPEMHDRIIAGLAYQLSAPLLSSDPIITAASPDAIIW